MANQNDILSRSYDSVYLNQKILFSNLISGSFPMDRFQACVYLAKSGNRVLDIGCGDGNVLYNLRDRFTELYGVELSGLRAKKLEDAAIEYGVNLNVSQENIENGLPFPDGYFDSIIWSDVIEHVVDLWSAMTEINRLLCQKGTLITTTPNIAYIRHCLTLLQGSFPSTASSDEGFNVRNGELYDGGHLHYFTFSSLAKLYRKYGINPIKTIGVGRLGFLHNIYPSMFSGSVCMVGIKE
jgi:SAM-dependent methyltransferase